MWNLEYMRAHENNFKDFYNLCPLKELIKAIENEKKNLALIKGREISRLQKKDLQVVFQKSKNKVVDSMFCKTLTNIIQKNTKYNFEEALDENGILKISVAKDVYEKLSLKSTNFYDFVNCIYQEEQINQIISSEDYNLCKESEEHFNIKKMKKDNEELLKKYNAVLADKDKFKKNNDELTDKYQKLKAEFTLYKSTKNPLRRKEMLEQILSKEKFDLVDIDCYIHEDFNVILRNIVKREVELTERLIDTQSENLIQILSKEYLQINMFKYIILKMYKEKGEFK